MVTSHHSPPALRLLVPENTLCMFTTVLQAGIEIKSRAGETLGELLQRLPGFTPEYIGRTVQTIFLDHTPVDDLAAPLTGSHPTVAISAAMPGLAGAIFRKDSIHAALRLDKPQVATTGQPKETTVTLKLFNTIAQDRGIDLLQNGVTIRASHLAEFLQARPTLGKHLVQINLADRSLAPGELLAALGEHHLLNLQIKETTEQ